MRKINLLILLSLFTILLGCSNEKSVYSRLDQQFKNCLYTVTGTATLKCDLYMVIPRAGCGGCISTAEMYMIQCLQEPAKHRFIKFVLTDFDSDKLLKARYGAYYKSSQLIIDKNSVFAANNSLKSIYPTIYFFNRDQKLYKVAQCSPKENGLAAIREYERNHKTKPGA